MRLLRGDAIAAGRGLLQAKQPTTIDGLEHYVWNLKHVLGRLLEDEPQVIEVTGSAAIEEG